MKIRSILAAAMAGVVLLAAAGCASASKGRTQMVTVTSQPSGATTKINGVEVGVTPIKVDLPRKKVYRVDVAKAGYAAQTALILPVPNEYDGKFFRWGMDEERGATTDLSPDKLAFELKPAGAATAAPAAKTTSTASTQTGGRYQEMSDQISKTDAMLQKGEITAEEHKVLIDQIIESYTK